MAHPRATKSHACALLMAGGSVSHVAMMTGVPKQTISRWLNQDVDLLRAECLRTNPNVGAVVAVIGGALPRLARRKRSPKRRKKNGTSVKI